ncbi:PQQ-binding-like beta-propeller repeat protein [Paenibacillus sp. J22TS3]|uniref:outer membrane protein assembly factor BamB family protein n=1 Tax=Paenibacillus sp. J22TS3 TaxID=2807192 RepID=UPI001B0BE91E|nr:PQQ-binding-like beta-propeller repeat protein [Paenibacillus sp. J22TS3]GIP21560.1 hypothetical protein J22TS3_18350 [Paenibacillus sp. J22TS3]
MSISVKKIFLVAAVLGLSVTVCGLTSYSHAAAEASGLSMNHWTKPSEKGSLRPLWSIPAASPIPENKELRESRAAAGDGQFYIVQQGVLKALDAADGQVRWSYGADLNPKIVYSQGSLYGSSEDGTIFAVNSKGKKLWESARTVTKAGKLVSSGDTLYVLRGIDIFAFNIHTGQLRWENHDTFAADGGMELAVQEGVVFRSYTGGITGSAGTLKAFDASTGVKLWERSGVKVPILIRDGAAYAVCEPGPFAEPEAELKLTALHVKSGEIKNNYLYNWSPRPLSGMRGYTAEAVIKGDLLYASHNGQAVIYALSQYTGAGDQPKEMFTGQFQDIVQVLPGSYSDRIFYEARSSLPYLLLKSIHIKDKSTVTYNIDNPAAQISIFGNGVYVGQMDGKFRAFELGSGAGVFTVETDSRNYGPVLFEKGYMLIQTDSQFLGIKIPDKLN